MAKNILRFKDKRQSDITKFLKTHLNFSQSSAKAFAYHMDKSEQHDFSSEDMIKIAKKHNLDFGLSWTEGNDSFKVQKNDFKFPNDLDETQLEYSIWLCRNNFHTNTIPFHDMTTKQWEDYLFTEHHCTRNNAKKIAESMYMLLHGLFISPEKTPLHPL